MVEIKTVEFKQEHESHVREHLNELVLGIHSASVCLKVSGVDQELGALIMMLSLGVLMANKEICGVTDEQIVEYVRKQVDQKNLSKRSHLN